MSPGYICAFRCVHNTHYLDVANGRGRTIGIAQASHAGGGEFRSLTNPTDDLIKFILLKM